MAKNIKTSNQEQASCFFDEGPQIIIKNKRFIFIAMEI